MSRKDYGEFEKLASILVEVSEEKSNNIGNVTHQDGGGIMKTIDWRVGYEPNPIILG